jgi:hypothetical protein
MRKKRDAHRVLVGNPKGKRPLESPRHRWEDNIKMDIREIWCGMVWEDLTKDGVNGRLL